MNAYFDDAVAFAISIAYCTIVVGIAELIRKLRGYGDEFTRKFVHIAIGLWIIPTLFLFAKWYDAAALPALAIVANVLSHRYGFLRGIERKDKSDLGTVYFPVSFVACIALFFSSPYPDSANGLFPGYPAAAAVGIVIMALGDAFAALIGTRFGRHPYTFFGAKKSAEGSSVMLVMSASAAFATFAVFEVDLVLAAVVAVALAFVATVLEAAGKHGLDNLTVPIACSILARVLLEYLGPLLPGASLP